MWQCGVYCWLPLQCRYGWPAHTGTIEGPSRRISGRRHVGHDRARDHVQVGDSFPNYHRVLSFLAIDASSAVHFSSASVPEKARAEDATRLLSGLYTSHRVSEKTGWIDREQTCCEAVEDCSRFAASKKQDSQGIAVEHNIATHYFSINWGIRLASVDVFDFLF